MICSFGSRGRIVKREELLPEMFEDRFFKPGVIHGNEDMLYGVYLNDAKAGTEDDPDTFELAMITRETILEAAKAPKGELKSIIWSESESFGCRNDGSSEFCTIVDEWEKSSEMTDDELIRWAKTES